VERVEAVVTIEVKEAYHHSLPRLCCSEAETKCRLWSYSCLALFAVLDELGMGSVISRVLILADSRDADCHAEPNIHPQVEKASDLPHEVATQICQVDLY